jgi:hypothetical protein
MRLGPLLQDCPVEVKQRAFEAEASFLVLKMLRSRIPYPAEFSSFGAAIS